MTGGHELLPAPTGPYECRDCRDVVWPLPSGRLVFLHAPDAPDAPDTADDDTDVDLEWREWQRLHPGVRTLAADQRAVLQNLADELGTPTPTRRTGRTVTRFLVWWLLPVTAPGLMTWALGAWGLLASVVAVLLWAAAPIRDVVRGGDAA